MLLSLKYYIKRYFLYVKIDVSAIDTGEGGDWYTFFS